MTLQREHESPEVSVVIPCYNQGKFLGEAIKSVLDQTFHDFEIIVIDDGSTDDTAAIASGYPSIVYKYQENRGPSTARNEGFAISNGTYIVFLDADDRLLPEALQIGVDCLRGRQDYAFVSGLSCYIDADGLFIEQLHGVEVRVNHYLALLRFNYICGLHTVMFRRRVLQEVGAFNPCLRAFEDYDLYLRIAKRFPVFHHGELIAEYRRHGANASGNAPLLLTTGLAVLCSHCKHAENIKEHRDACNFGVRWMKRVHGTNALLQHIKGEVSGDAMTPGFLAVLRHVPEYLPKAVLKALLPASVWNWLRPRWRALQRSDIVIPQPWT
jgi:glycosyltransferase involved in cell wall biosynthesis